MGEIGRHPFFCSLMLESGLRKPHFSIDCWFPSRFLSVGSIQERPEGWSWAEGTFSSLFPYFYCLWYITKVPHSGRDVWLQSSPTLSILIVSIQWYLQLLVPIQWDWHYLDSGPPQRALLCLLVPLRATGSRILSDWGGRDAVRSLW